MDDPGRVKAALETPSYQIRRLYIPFPQETLSSGYTLKELLEGWRTRPGNRAFRRENMEEAEFLYKTLGREYPKDSIRLIYGLITCSVDIKNGDYSFRANSRTLKFDGFLAVYSENDAEEKALPALKEGEDLKEIKVDCEQKFTEPPSR